MTPPTAVDRRVPITVVTGFLGAGKTTLVNSVLSNSSGRRIAVVQNEFAELDIDSSLIVHATEDIIELRNGCLCCLIREDVVRTLSDLHRRLPDLDHVLLETSGMADPSPLIQSLTIDGAGLSERFELARVVAVTDPRFIHLQLRDRDEVARQIAFADLVILNKSDLVDRASAEAAHVAVAAANPLAEIVEASWGAVPIHQVLEARDLDRRDLDAWSTPLHSTGIGAQTATVAGELSGPKLFRWLNDLLTINGSRILRSKGLFVVAGLDHLVVMQSVHQFLDVTAGPTRQPGDCSRLVLIGSGLDRLELETALEECRPSTRQGAPMAHASVAHDLAVGAVDDRGWGRR